MAITRKPKAHQQAAAVDVDDLISRGGSSPLSQPPAPKPGVTPVMLRIPRDMLQRIDAAVEARQLPTPRHTWILEAILEKLSREPTT